MKMKLLVAGSLIALGVFAGNDVGNAEVISVSPSNYLSTRALPNIQEVTLKSGEFLEFNAGGFYSDALVSKFVVKFKLDTCEPETIVVDRVGYYPRINQNRYSSYVAYGAYGTVTFTNLGDNLSTRNNFISKESIKIINASATTVNLKIGLSSGIHVRSQEIVDYSDINFDL